LITGLLVVLATWVALRASVGAGVWPLIAMLLDLGVVLLGWGLVLSLTARPLVAALVIVGLAVGLVVVDRVKRAVLREPVVFADRAELRELIRHPALYLPFAGTGRVVAGALVLVVGFCGLLALEPAQWRVSPVPPLLGILSVAAALALPGRAPLSGLLRRLYERLGPSRDPAMDATRFGLLAGFVIHATLARVERDERRAGLAPRRDRQPAGNGAIVLVQSESFFDVARLDPSLGAAVLPAFTRCRQASALAGRLAVPCWGANTIRSEFAVLTGLAAERLGLDRFNPYAAFAHVPIEGIAWRARAAGWRTVCVHPFDLSFYSRRRVLPMLGFDTLIGPEAFSNAARGGLYVADVALAGQVADLLRSTPSGILIFAITMEGHGPWDASAPALDLPPALAGVPEAVSLARMLFRQRAADQAIPILTAALSARASGGVLGVYGDHQPSLPKAFAAIGLTDERTDYLIWRSHAAGSGAQRDLAAHELGAALCEAAGLPT
jgi:phosphoglycerol transferase MdoB-like AlkP superfamily enzyme